MPTTSHPSVDQLERALKLAQEIRRLESQLNQLLQSTGSAPAASSGDAAGSTSRPGKKAGKKAGRKGAKKRVMSPEARERIAAAQRARWAKQKQKA